MAATKKAATPKKPRATKAAPRTVNKGKTSSAPGESEQAHQWLMQTLAERDVRSNDPNDAIEADTLPEEVRDIPDEDDTTCGPTEEELEAKAAVKDAKTGRFLPGNKSGGRKKGSRSKLATEFFDDFYNHWLGQDEETGRPRGMAAIEWVYKNRPDLYFQGAIKVLPQQVDVKVSEFEQLTDDAIDRRIADIASQLGDVQALLKPEGRLI